MLQIEEIHTYYGLSHVLQGLSLEVNDRELVALIGRNGAGKSTTLKSVMGITPPRRGQILLDGRNITTLPTHLIVRKGVSYVPEERRIVPGLSAYQNVTLATLPNKGRLNEAEALERIYSYFPVLYERRNQDGKSLSGGEQQMLAIARALINNPKVLLVDEPTQGLSPIFVRSIAEILIRIKQEGVSILLVEQNAKIALELADRVYVIDNGMIQFSGSSSDVSRDESIQRTFLSV